MSKLLRYPPMLLTKTDMLPLGEEWGYEPKLDDWRVEAQISANGTARLVSRENIDHTRRFSAAAEQLPLALGGNSAVVDGEMVGFDQAGTPSFGELRRRQPRAIYHIFDLLEINGEPLISQPLLVRRNHLHTLFAKQENVHLVDMYDDPELILAAAIELALEGVVAKKKSSPYQPGKRTRNWQKFILRTHTDGFGRH